MNPFSRRYMKRRGVSVSPPGQQIPIRGGHYVDYVFNGSPIVNNTHPFVIADYTNARNEIQTTTALRGGRYRVIWRQIETSQGVYDWSAFDTFMGHCLSLYTTAGKTFMLLIAVTTSTQIRNDLTPPLTKGQGHLVPNYLQDGPTGATYKNGQWPYDGASADTGGWRMRFDNTATKTRFKAFLSAMIARVQNYAGGALWPAFEGISFTEGSIGALANGADAGWTGFTNGSWTAPTSTAYFDGYFDCLGHLVTLLPDKHVFASMNHPIGIKPPPASDDEGMHVQVPRMQTGRLGFCTPNIVPDDANLWRLETEFVYKGTLRYFADYKAILPLAPNIQGEDYDWTQINNAATPGHVPTIQELYLCCRDELFAHYIIWQRQQGNSRLPGVPAGTKNWDKVFEFLTSPGAHNSLNGGLSTIYPSIYST